MSRYDDIASALAAADWSGVSIGNKAIILAAIDALGTASRANTALSALLVEYVAGRKEGHINSFPATAQRVVRDAQAAVMDEDQK